jgi:hypothetical protein
VGLDCQKSSLDERLLVKRDKKFFIFFAYFLDFNKD